MRNSIELALFHLIKRIEIMKKSTVLLFMGVSLCIFVLGFQTDAYATLNYFQGFEVDTGDWVMYLGNDGITQVPSGGGTLMVPSASGDYHAEIQNDEGAYDGVYFGMAGYSFYGGKDSVYHGDFYQSIDVYIDVDWALPIKYPSLAGFWIDMTPYHEDPNNYGAEHNFRVKALGSSVEVYVDGQTTPIATLNNSGWYTFLMTWEKADNDSDPVITHMSVYDSDHNQQGSTAEVYATSPGGPFLSSDLKGNGYVWFTVWQNGFADNVLAIDNQRTGLLPWPVPTSKEQCQDDGWQNLFHPDNSVFKNQGDCVQFVENGK